MWILLLMLTVVIVSLLAREFRNTMAALCGGVQHGGAGP